MFSRARDGVLVPNGTLASQGEKLAAAERVDRREVALAVEPSWATRPELLVEGVTFYPRIREDMEHAESSIHVIRFGFKPGTVGDVFAELLERRARQGIAVRLIVDENGSAASGRSRAMYERLAEAGAEIVVNVGSKLRAARGPVAGDRGIVWNLRNAGHIDHRKMVIVDGRVGWVGRAGFEDHFADGRFTTSSCASRVRSSPSSSSSSSRASATTRAASRPGRKRSFQARGRDPMTR